MLAPFVLEELTLSQNASLRDLYQLYCQNFPLPDEQESYPNFRRCLELNADAAVQKDLGPYHEFYLTIREYDKSSGLYDTIVGGLIFGVCTSAAHAAKGYLCSVQVIYLFRTSSEGLRRFLYAGKAMLEEEIEKRARAACRLARFRDVIGDEPSGRVAMFFEVNNPGLMSPEEIQIDRDLSQVHPALRHVMWTNHHTRPLAFRYVQPPLSLEQQPARYLDLFAVTVPREEPDGGARLSVGSSGQRGVPGTVLAEHLRRFFHVSVLKGDESAMRHACLPPPFPADEAAKADLLTANSYCDALAAVEFVPLVADQDPGLKRIKAQAIELSVTKTRMLIHQPARQAARRWFQSMLPRAKRWIELVTPLLATVLLVVAAAAEFAEKTLDWRLRIPGLHEMEILDHALEIFLAVIIISFFWRAFNRQREQRRSDRSPTALGIALHAIEQNVEYYHGSHLIIILRDVLSDRAAHHLRTHVLLQGTEPAPSDAEPSVLSRFIASRTLTPYLAELGLSGFNRDVQDESGRIETALRLYSAGAMQSMYRKTPWHAYYTCVFPVLHRVLAGEATYGRLSDFDRWIDAEIVAMLGLSDPEREERFTALHEAGGEVCLFVSHILDLPWDESDPGSPPEFLIPPRISGNRPAPTMLEARIAEYWTMDAELACGRMLAVVAHLASVMRLMAEHRQITTGMFCRCTVVVHVTAEPSIRFLESLGFAAIPSPESESDSSDVLGGKLLECKILPGASDNLHAHGAGATAAFFGLINEVALNIRDR